MVSAAELEKHLATRAYIDGDAASTADVAVFETLKLSDIKEPHTARWYKHIASYAGETSSLASGKVPFAGIEAAAGAAPAAEEEDDEDIDLFGSDDEVDEEAERVKAERIAEYNKIKEAKKQEKLAAGKTLEVAKSVVTLQVKPWDDETDMKELEDGVRAIEMDGLLWGASKLVPVGYGIKMLQINLVIEDAKVSLQDLQDKITDDLEDFVQSTDIAAMQKL
jgi:elongation factor 1-beta